LRRRRRRRALRPARPIRGDAAADVGPARIARRGTRGPMTAVLRAPDGTALPAPSDRWVEALTIEDDSVLARAVGPVLDVGFRPGRHVLALAERGVVALGID